MKRVLAGLTLAALLGMSSIAAAEPTLSNFEYPRNVGVAGTPLPCCQGATGIFDFDNISYDGVADGNNVNERMRWVKDPGGSGKTVTRIRLAAGDHTTQQPSDHRAEIYSSHRDLYDHQVGWQVLGIRIPAGNSTSIPYYNIFQNHASGNALQNTPPQDLVIHGSDNKLALGIRKLNTPAETFHVLGSGAPGVWHYVVLHIRFASDNTGFVDAWEADGKTPNVGQVPPAWSDHGYSTLNGGTEPSRTHIGFYASDDINWAGTGFYCGYHRAATYAEARVLPNCP